jgi:hypothetical protein
MSDKVMADPPQENITGEKKVIHHFTNGIDWKVNVSHLLLAMGLVVGLYLLHKNTSLFEDDPGGEGDVEADDPDGGGLAS